MKRCLGCMESYENDFIVCPYCGYVEGTLAEEKIHMEPGTILQDRYIIGKVLGFGGFGVTYIAWDGKLQQKVAIKEFFPGEFSTRMPGQSTITVFSGDKSEQFYDGLKKFLEEAKRLAKFKNEAGIVKIFDAFEENSTAYIIMEYLEGETLTSYLNREGVISEEDAINILTPIMLSLQTIHAEGILHRDIAPDNIFITKSGEVKLIDFGASRYATTTHSRSLTVIIKPGYSPEEQYRSRSDQGPHTDVYAIAATLYKMITGKTPPDAMVRRAEYEDKNRDILIMPHILLKKNKVNNKISVDRETAILNAMNVRIEDRTPDIGTFLDELNSDEPVKRRQGKIRRIDIYTWPLWLKITIPAILSVFLITGILLLTGVINLGKYTTEITLPENTVIVPDVEGKKQEEAVAELNDMNLEVNIKGREYEYQPAGVIVVQNPIQGTYATINTKVDLIVSKGQVVGPENGMATVPFLIGSTRKKALIDIRAAGLVNPSIKEEYSDEFDEGLVITQKPEAGEKVKEGKKITIVISLGAKAFELPSVVGKTMEEADKELKDLGLQVVIEQKKDPDVPVGRVISQSIEAGTEVKKSDSVTIVVSSGAPTVVVPSVVGSDKTSAKAKLEKNGFKVQIKEQYSSSVKSGVVISQYPQANTTQSKGTLIEIVVSKGTKSNITTTKPTTTKPTTTKPTTTKPTTTKPTTTKQIVTVKLDANGGYVSNDTITVKYGSTYPSLPTPTRDQYTFWGWSISKTLRILVVPNSTPVALSSNHTLYAIWDPIATTTKPTTTIAPKVTISGPSSGGSSLQFTANANISNPSYSWSSSNNSVATVSNGTVKAVGEGTAIITVTMNGKYTDSRTVRVGINWGSEYTTTTKQNESALIKQKGSYTEWKYYRVVCGTCGYHDWYGTTTTSTPNGRCKNIYGCSCNGCFTKWETDHWSTNNPDNLSPCKRFPSAKSYVDSSDREWYWYPSFKQNGSRTVYTYVNGSYVITVV